VFQIGEPPGRVVAGIFRTFDRVETQPRPCPSRMTKMDQGSGQLLPKGSVNHLKPSASRRFVALMRGLFVRSYRPHRTKRLKLVGLRLLSTITLDRVLYRNVCCME